MLANVPRCREIARQTGVDFLVSATAENSLYLSGVVNPGQRLFPYTDEFYVAASTESVTDGIIVLPAGRAEMALDAYEDIQHIITFGPFRRGVSLEVELSPEEKRVQDISIDRVPRTSALEALSDALDLLGATKSVVGIDERGPDRSLFEGLSARFPMMQLRPAADLFRRVRQVKTEAELARMITALRINEAGFRAVWSEARTGITERELSIVFASAVIQAGGSPSYSMIRFGRGMALLMRPAGDAALRPGDSIFMDAGTTFEGYKSDIGRLVSFGDAGTRLQKLYAASMAAQERAIELMVPGRTANDVFLGAVEAARSSGNPLFQRHHVGHGIGLEWNDIPMLSPGVETVVETGMVFEVEAPYYEVGFGGTHLEDTVIITSTSNRVVSELPRELQTFDVR